MEFDGDYVHIKSEGTGKYFGNDDNVEWASVYSDKAASGNDKSYFRLMKSGESSVGSIHSDRPGKVSGVYNMQGIRVADSLDDIQKNGCGGMYIVVSGNVTRKIVL